MSTISWWRGPLVLFAVVSSLAGAILAGQQTPAAPCLRPASALQAVV